MTMRTSTSTTSPSAPRVEQIAQREHVRAEAQLEVDRGGQLALAAAGAGSPRVGEVPAHRLLDQHGGAAGQLLEDAEDLIAGDGEVEDGVARRGRARRASETRCRIAKAPAVDRARVGIDVEEAGDGKPSAR